MSKILSIETFIDNDIFNNIYMTGCIKIPSKDNMYYSKGEYFMITKIKLINSRQYLPVILSTKFCFEEFNEKVFIKGKISNKFYNYNKKGYKKRLVNDYIFVKDIETHNNKTDINKAYIKGKLLKKSELQVTPYCKYIKAMVLIRNKYGKKEMIPIVFYNRDAIYIDLLPKGTNVNIVGKVMPHHQNSNQFIIKNQKVIME